MSAAFCVSGGVAACLCAHRVQQNAFGSVTRLACSRFIPQRRFHSDAGVVRNASLYRHARRGNTVALRTSDHVAVGGAFRLAPSDFAFLWEECRRCFYLKAHKTLYRPRAPFPSIFGSIDLAMKRHLRGLRTTDVIPDMPPGIFLCEDNDAWVECRPIVPPRHERSVYIRGMVSISS